jgi:hypothetical protein
VKSEGRIPSSGRNYSLLVEKNSLFLSFGENGSPLRHRLRETPVAGLDELSEIVFALHGFTRTA